MHLDEKTITAKLQINRLTQKLFIFDLDGTIIFDGVKLTDDFATVLAEIKQAGHNIYFATGRSYRDYLPMLPDWCHEFPAVTFGGGLVTNQTSILQQKFMCANELSGFIHELDKRQATYLIDSHTSYFHSSADSWILQDILKISAQHPNYDLDEVLREGAYKLLVLDDSLQSLAKEFSQKFAWELKHHSYHNCFDVMPKNVNKYDGVSKLPLLAKENIFVFGNDHNDLELMQNFDNNILFGDYAELLPYAKVNIAYDDNLSANFHQVIKTILKK